MGFGVQAAVKSMLSSASRSLMTGRTLMRRWAQPRGIISMVLSGEPERAGPSRTASTAFLTDVPRSGSDPIEPLSRTLVISDQECHEFQGVLYSEAGDDEDVRPRCRECERWKEEKKRAEAQPPSRGGCGVPKRRKDCFPKHARPP